MQPEIYSDGIGEIIVSGSVVRVDLMSLSATERDASNNPKSVFRQRIIFSLEAFANSAEVMLKALEGLIEAGAVARNLPVKTVSVPAEATLGQSNAQHAPVAADRRNTSPNFG